MAEREGFEHILLIKQFKNYKYKIATKLKLVYHTVHHLVIQ